MAEMIHAVAATPTQDAVGQSGDLQFDVARDDLTELVGMARRGVPQKSTNMIFSCVLLTAQETGPQAKLTAYGLGTDMRVLAEGTANVKKTGSIALPAKRLADTLSVFPAGGALSVSCNGMTGRAELRCGSIRTTLIGLPGEDYPLAADMEIDYRQKLPVHLFADMVSETRQSASPDLSRMALSGINVAKTGRTLTMTATDGYRLAEAKADLDDEAGGDVDWSIIVPAEKMDELAGLLKSSGADHFWLGVSGESNGMRIAVKPQENPVSRADVILQLINAKYPNYRQIIPVNPTLTVAVQHEDLDDRLRAAYVISSESTDGRVIFTVPPGDGPMTIYTSEAETGSALAEMPIERIAGEIGETLTFAVNIKYVRNALRCTPKGNLRFGLTSPLKPVLIEPEEHKHGLIHVIMPMHINQRNGTSHGTE